MTVFFDDDDHDDAAQSPPWTFAIKVYEAKRGMRKHLVHEVETNFNWKPFSLSIANPSS